MNSPDDYAAEIRRLKEELKFQRLRADACDGMLTVAEQRFKVNIRKKLVPNGKEPVYTGR
ncbi:hypothetical protein [Hoylesella pleuritidis]|uniref:Uncharacterized protein n=1 Tax=Hoylesella pleuritidis F0068 TaxID=1081904 RepID=U2LBC4_9BACT|nr:hypothetical protein [Hoylesella pleuritidis]ERK01606.1 hypothetical protein HMPREF1218_2313 [Hoylesella pleuritidis F0068]